MAPTLEVIVALLVAIHAAALAGLLVMARRSVRLVDDAELPLARHEPEWRPGEQPDPTGYRAGAPLRPEPRCLS